MAPSDDVRASRVAPRRRRILAVSIWTVPFIGSLALVGLPTDPMYAFAWLWALTIAWNIDRPWRSHLGFLRDWVGVVALLVAYNLSRGYADNGVAVHVTSMIDADRHMWGWLTGGELPTAWLQEHLYSARHIYWYDVVMSFVYFSHFIVTPVVATILWIRSREWWKSFVVRWFTLSALGLLTYFLYPAAPPWWAGKHGYIAELPSGVATRGWSAIGLHGAGNVLNAAKIDVANQVAAMPSLHSAFALLIVVFFFGRVRKRWWPLLAAYPVAMAFTLVYSGEHYVIDVLVGWSYVLLTFVIARLGEHAWAARRRHIDGKQPSPGKA